MKPIVRLLVIGGGIVAGVLLWKRFGSAEAPSSGEEKVPSTTRDNKERGASKAPRKDKAA